MKINLTLKVIIRTKPQLPKEFQNKLKDLQPLRSWITSKIYKKLKKDLQGRRLRGLSNKNIF